MGQGGMPVPKPARGSSRKARRSQRAGRGKAFRDAVWKQAIHDGGGMALCADCGRGPLMRTLDVLHPMAGHVAHHKGRRVDPFGRFDPAKASLKCRNCHMREHGQKW